MLAAQGLARGCLRRAASSPRAVVGQSAAGPCPGVAVAAAASTSTLLRASASGLSWSSGQSRGYCVAIVGSGPGAFYTAKYLFKQAQSAGDAAAADARMQIDMFERLPTPFGLVRFGVAPDHPEVKNVINDFGDVAKTPGFRFFGNVHVGQDVSLDLLRQSYDAVVVCIGAQSEKLLRIPGENLSGVIGAPAFVKWYNSHPDHVGLQPRDPGSAVSVIGQGNVALDIARILTRSPKELNLTDIEPLALKRIEDWHKKGLQTVHVIGRRGFVQAAFTNKELRELDTYDEVLPIIDPAELELCRNPASEQELSKNRMKKRSVQILEKMAENFSQRETTSKRIVWMRFLSSPAEVIADASGESVAALRVDRTKLEGEPGQQSAVKTGKTEDIPCGLVVRSVGFDLAPLEGVPLDERKRVPHKQGRVEDPAGGLYVSGWVKRGPTGIIASNIADAQETAARIMADLKSGAAGAAGTGASMVETTIASKTSPVSFDAWRKIEAEELRLGAEQGRAAVKCTDIGEMLKLARAGAP